MRLLTLILLFGIHFWVTNGLALESAPTVMQSCGGLRPFLKACEKIGGIRVVMAAKEFSDSRQFIEGIGTIASNKVSSLEQLIDAFVAQKIKTTVHDQTLPSSEEELSKEIEKIDLKLSRMLQIYQRVHQVKGTISGWRHLQ